MSPWALVLALSLQDSASVTHSVTGVVVDSIRRGPMAGAEVMLAGTAISGITDSLGRFRLDSIPPGNYRIAFFHPFLDSISVAIAPRTLTVPLDDGKGVMLGVPSVASLVGAICKMPPSKSQSILVGRVLDPESSKPVAGASVFVSWIDFEVKRQALNQTRHTLQGGTDAGGVYRVCGLPAELNAVVYATRDSASTSSIGIASSRPGLILRDLTLEDPFTSRGRRASLEGVVRSPSGLPVEGASVGVAGSSRNATTGADGTFTLSDLPLGTRNVLVRKLGFAPKSIPVDLNSHVTQYLNAELSERVTTIDPMYVVGQRDRALERVGFTTRRRQGLGDFRTRADFERSNPRYLSDILGRMRGVRVDYSEGQRIMRGTGLGTDCIHLVVDGVPWEFSIPGAMDDAVLPEHVSAIEVYSGSAVPPQFEGVWSRGCAAVVVWTRTRVKDFVR